jgi:hypothetical protein
MIEFPFANDISAIPCTEDEDEHSRADSNEDVGAAGMLRIYQTRASMHSRTIS